MGRAENTFGKQDTHCTPPEVFEPILEALHIDAFGLDPFGNPNSDVPAKQVIMLPKYREATKVTAVTAAAHEGRTTRQPTFSTVAPTTSTGRSWARSSATALRVTVSPGLSRATASGAATRTCRCGLYAPARTGGRTSSRPQTSSCSTAGASHSKARRTRRPGTTR